MPDVTVHLNIRPHYRWWFRLFFHPLRWLCGLGLLDPARVVKKGMWFEVVR